MGYAPQDELEDAAHMLAGAEGCTRLHGDLTLSRATREPPRARPMLRWRLLRRSSDPAALPDARLIEWHDHRLVRWPEVPLIGRLDGWLVGRRFARRPNDQLIRLFARPSRHLIG
jgi:hypothetical protein